MIKSGIRAENTAIIIIDSKRNLDNYGLELRDWLVDNFHLIHRQDFFWYALHDYNMIQFEFFGDTGKAALFFALKFSGKTVIKDNDKR